MKFAVYLILFLFAAPLFVLPGCAVKRKDAPPTAPSSVSEKETPAKPAKTMKKEKLSRSSEAAISSEAAPPPTGKIPTDPNNITGSVWTLSYKDPEIGDREYDIIFHRNGRLENLHPNEKTAGNDRWEQEGKKIILRFNDDFAIYEGKMQDKMNMSGEARSRSGLNWTWKASRKD